MKCFGREISGDDWVDALLLPAEPVGPCRLQYILGPSGPDAFTERSPFLNLMVTCRTPPIHLSSVWWRVALSGLCRGTYCAYGPSLRGPRRFDGRREQHHEIYLSEPRRVDPSRMKTALRQPFRILTT